MVIIRYLSHFDGQSVMVLRLPYPTTLTVLSSFINLEAPSINLKNRDGYPLFLMDEMGLQVRGEEGVIMIVVDVSSGGRMIDDVEREEDSNRIINYCHGG